MTPDQTNALSTITAMTTAFEARNLDGIMATYAKGATVVFDPGAPIADAATIKARFTEVFGIDPKFTFGEHEVIISGDTALHITPWTMTGQVPDGPAISESGLSVAVLLRQADGAWLMVIDNPHGQRLLP
ncbi:nuclear transport factor 2 family protein [Yoonia sp. R2331]|uniref:YybH family protein n=1 Tax=Yoonia sp. R2331 TaxID=3237238 RepID=UPI0034E405B0